MTQIIAYVLSALTAILSIRSGLLDPLLEWIKDFVTTDIPSFIWSILPTSFADYFNQFDLAVIAGYIQDFTWFVPFWEIMFVYLTAIGIASSVLLLRYIIGWVPTIEG